MVTGSSLLPKYQWLGYWIVPFRPTKVPMATGSSLLLPKYQWLLDRPFSPYKVPMFQLMGRPFSSFLSVVTSPTLRCRDSIVSEECRHICCAFGLLLRPCTPCVRVGGLHHAAAHKPHHLKAGDMLVTRTGGARR